MKDKQHKVSIIMGLYNTEKTLRESIQSILDQTYTDWELIMCDDGSTDQTYQIASQYAKQHEKIILLKNKQNSGLAYSLNQCLSQAKGEYIARMDSDDQCVPERLMKQVEYLNQHPEVELVGGWVNLFDEQGVWGQNKTLLEPSLIDVVCDRKFIHPTVMIRKQALMDVGGYTVSKLTWRAEDYDLWCKLYEKGYKGHNLPEILLFYREDAQAYKKRKAKYKFYGIALRIKWKTRLKIPGYRKSIVYSIIKTILSLLCPTKLVVYSRRRRFKN